MNSLQECVNEYIKDGYTRNYAISKVCQDIIINRIYNSKYSNKITIKGWSCNVPLNSKYS